MEPGPELDALVAEKVMGWEQRHPKHWAECAGTGGLGDSFEYRRSQAEWSPSTSIADAWEVVENIKHPHRRSVFVGFDCAILTEGPYQCCVNEPDGLCVASAWADTAPHAICLAALKAVGAM